MEVLCVNCSKPKKFRCSVCLYTTYCSKECQDVHWKKEHKQTCVAPESLEALTYFGRFDKNDRYRYSKVSHSLFIEKFRELLMQYVPDNDSMHSCSCKVCPDVFTFGFVKISNFQYQCYIKCKKKRCRVKKIKGLLMIAEILDSNGSAYVASFLNIRKHLVIMSVGNPVFDNLSPDEYAVCIVKDAKKFPILKSRRDSKYYYIDFETNEIKLY